jgi:hypothetical protein
MFGVNLSWRTVVAPIAVAVCGTAIVTEWPHELPVQPPAMVRMAIPTAAHPAIDVAAELRAIGKRWVKEHLAPAAAPDEDTPRHLLAVGTCKRPSDAEQQALARRVQRWIDHRFPREQSAGDVAIATGCESARGIVITADDQRGARGKDVHEEIDRTFVLRVRPDAIEVLAEKQAEGRELAMEWSDEGYVAVLALVDLDGDGVHDTLIDRVEHEGGASRSDHSLEVALTRAGNRSILAGMSGQIYIRGRDAVPIVLGFDFGYDEPPEYVCLDSDLALKRCLESETLRDADRMESIADRYIALKDSDVPDRELLAEELTFLGVPRAQRERLVASAPATEEPQRAQRQIAELAASLNPRDRLGEVLHPGAPDPEARAYFDTLRHDLGDTSCRPHAATADVRRHAEAWVREHTIDIDRENGQCAKAGPCERAAPMEIAVTPACGPYVWVSWQDPAAAGTSDEEQHHIVLFGRGMKRIVTHSDPGSSDNGTYEPSTMDAVFFRHGTTVMAGVRVDDHTIVAVADERIVGTRSGGFSLYMFAQDLADTSDDLFYEPATATVWHPTPSGFEAITAPEVVAHEDRRRALMTLSIFELRLASDPHYRADCVHALQVFHASPALIEGVAKLR